MADAKKVEGAGKPVDGEGNGNGKGDADLVTLTNALRLEREKNEVLLNEVVTLEDELVNRQLTEFESVISDASRDFWREQLLSNREAAQAALAELKTVGSMQLAVGSEQLAVGSEEPETKRRPLHNRQTVRPAVRRGFAGEGGEEAPGADSLAVRIRNRASELSKMERIPFSTASRRAEREVSGQ